MLFVMMWKINSFSSSSSSLLEQLVLAAVLVVLINCDSDFLVQRASAISMIRSFDTDSTPNITTLG